MAKRTDKAEKDGLDVLSGFCMMTGSFEHSIDAQGRFAVPADWRGESPSGVFLLIPGREATLQIYTPEIFEERILRKLKSLSPSNPDDLRKLRQLGSQISKCECDKQGRIQIPQKLLQYARLGEKAALVGTGDFGQILDAARWRDEQKQQDNLGDSFLDILG